MKFLAIILAAGKGSRLKSRLAKPLHEVAGRALIAWVSEAAETAGASTQICVIPHDGQRLIQQLGSSVQTVVQDPPRGTGDAVRCCLAQIQALAKDWPVIILYADTPLIQADTLRALAQKINSGVDLCLLGFNAANPAGYGRIILSDDHTVQAIIEDKDAVESERDICLVNGGVMAAKADIFNRFLPQLNDENNQNELYLTDLIALAAGKGAAIDVLVVGEAELAGVNDRTQLAQAETALQNRLRAKAMADGVTLQAPETVFLSADTQFGTDIVIEPHVVIGKGVSVADECHIKAFSHLEGAVLAKGCIVGPYARLRPGTSLGQGVKIGNFVETKNAVFADNAKANHLSYLGDADIGQGVNIGAGVITCNYDGFNKFTTTIKDGAFIGSNSALVAPVTIGPNALVGAGSVITRDVGENAVGISRATQKQIKDGAEAHKKKIRQKKTIQKKTIQKKTGA